MPSSVAKKSRGTVPVFLGLDPGAGGAAAALVPSRPGARQQIHTFKLGGTEKDLWDWVWSWAPNRVASDSIEQGSDWEPFAVMEKVGGYIRPMGDGVGGGQPGSAAFKFGASYGALRMALTAAGIPFEEVTPRTWQAALGVAPRKKPSKNKVEKDNHVESKILHAIPERALVRTVAGESKGEFKNRLKGKAQQLFPSQKVTLATADALLMAEYCRRSRGGRCA